MRARRTDANLNEVAEEFENLGCTVWRVNDAVDLVVGYSGLCMLIECKDGKKSPSRRKLTPAQIKFRQWWTGGIYLVENIRHVYSAVDTLKRWHAAIRQPFAMDDRD